MGAWIDTPDPLNRAMQSSGGGGQGLNYPHLHPFRCNTILRNEFALRKTPKRRTSAEDDALCRSCPDPSSMWSILGLPWQSTHYSCCQFPRSLRRCSLHPVQAWRMSNPDDAKSKPSTAPGTVRQALPCMSKRSQRINPPEITQTSQDSVPLQHDPFKCGIASENH